MKRILVGLLFLSPLGLMAQINFTIKGKISGPMAAMKKVYLNYNNGEKYPPSDSAEVKNGEFEISGTMLNEEYNQARLTISNSLMGSRMENQLTVYPKKGDRITITISGDIHTAIISGSKQSQVYQSVQDSLSHAKDVEDKILIFKRLIEQYPDSKMSLSAFNSRFGFGISKSYGPQVPEIIKIYEMLSPRIRATKDGMTCAKALEEVSHLVVGGTLVDFTSKTPEGKVIKLSDYRGKYVLVDFWASWCIPCRAEFPYLKKAYARFKGKLEILGYSIDNDRSLWVSALENDDVPWINVSDLIGGRDPIALNYQINAVPSNFLIGPDGKVISINLRGELLEPTLAKFIK